LPLKEVIKKKVFIIIAKDHMEAWGLCLPKEASWTLFSYLNYKELLGPMQYTFELAMCPLELVNKKGDWKAM
jgi:hypothetical protein